MTRRESPSPRVHRRLGPPLDAPYLLGALCDRLDPSWSHRQSVRDLLALPPR